jgi:SAM-dependent methyltransferase
VDDFFARMRQRLEPSYLAADEPWKQSGFSGPEARWIAMRRPVADCIDRAGSFLDVGCANGYLVECVLRWSGERGLAVDPWGIDLSPPLVALAQARLPALADRFTVANAATWEPPRRFDFVRTELCYVPAADERAFVARLLARFVAPGGALLVCNYAEDQPDVAERILPGAHPTTKIVDRLVELGFTVETSREGVDAIKGRKMRVAVIRAA